MMAETKVANSDGHKAIDENISRTPPGRMAEGATLTGARRTILRTLPHLARFAPRFVASAAAFAIAAVLFTTFHASTPAFADTPPGCFEQSGSVPFGGFFNFTY